MIDILRDIRYAICRQHKINAWLAMSLSIAVWSELERDEQRYIAANTADDYLPEETRRAVNLMRVVEGASALAWYRV